MSEYALEISELSHRYGDRLALDRLSLTVNPGEFLAILGPNGGGKTTLFRLLSTLLRPQSGRLSVFGIDPTNDPIAVRQELGVVFQAPSLDKKLSVAENLYCQGRLYGMSTAEIRTRGEDLAERLGVIERLRDRVETLSGGLKRRVEISKSLLHGPRLLLLDEPSTGLDPLARYELWKYLNLLRERDGVTVVATTHFLDEAERADRTAIIHQGKLVAYDTPDALRSTISGESLTIRTSDPERLAQAIRTQLDLPAQRVDDAVRIEVPAAHRQIARIVDAFADDIESLTLGKPDLEDVFIARTGSRFHAEAPLAAAKGNAGQGLAKGAR